jgi:hypothetical protein
MKKFFLILAALAISAPAYAQYENTTRGMKLISDSVAQDGTWNLGTAATVGTLTATTGEFANGSAAAPSITFSSLGTSGMYLINPSIGFSVGGTLRFAIGDSAIYLYSGALYFGSSFDADMFRCGADHLCMLRSTNNQKFSVAGSFTDFSNYERGYISADSTGAIIGHEAAGTGVARAVHIKSSVGLIVNDTGTKPTCDATTRGAMWRDEGGTSAADTFEVCAKNSSDTYDWYALATIP